MRGARFLIQRKMKKEEKGIFLFGGCLGDAAGAYIFLGVHATGVSERDGLAILLRHAWKI